LLDLHLELLIAVLELLNGAGELTQCVLHAVEANGEIAGVGLRAPAGWTRLPGVARLRRWLASVEQIVEEIARPALILRQRRAGQKQQRQCGKCRESR
jgi:hypothetical protein